MKNQSTDKIYCFDSWRIQNSDKYGSFIWPQVNYNANTADTVSLVFEQVGNKNIDTKCYPNFWDGIRQANIKFFVLSFDSKSKYYIHPNDIAKEFDLVLKKQTFDLSKVNTYWEYRLETMPQNCLTTDIDSLEFTDNNRYIAIEAAQLFETDTINAAIPNIFRTFNWRKNKVNPQQYLAQYKVAQLLKGFSFILFHKIDFNNKLDEDSACFLLKNDESFFNLLVFIKSCEKNDEIKFEENYSKFLNENLMYFENIHFVYRYIKSL